MKLPPRFKLAAFSSDFGLSISGAKLFRLFLLFLCQGKALGFFATCRAFPNVVSSVTVSHKVLTLAFPQALPSFFALSARGLLCGFFRFLACGDCRKWNNLRWRISVLAKRGFERQLAVRDFSQCYICMTHSGSELDEWTMPEGELADTP
jgi:hypothetical protein